MVVTVARRPSLLVRLWMLLSAAWDERADHERAEQMERVRVEAVIARKRSERVAEAYRRDQSALRRRR